MSSDPTETLKSLLVELLSESKDQNQQQLEERLLKCKKEVQKLQHIQQARSSSVIAKFRLDDQIALVTGGGRGIGRAFCHALGEAGAKIAVADLLLERAESVATELKAKGIEAVAIQVDVSKKDDCEAMVQKVLDTWGDLNIACNNAGIVSNSNSEETTQEEWDMTMGVNLSGVFFCCQAEAKHMLTKGRGKIINTASICAQVSVRPQNQVAYNASKAGVAHLTRTLGAEWAGRGVCVNSISPGYIDTPLLESDDLLPLKQEWIDNDVPMRRLGGVEDLIGAVIYLASSSSDFVVGRDIVIDGGLTCW